MRSEGPVRSEKPVRSENRVRPVRPERGGRGGRHEQSVGGLIGALLVLLLGVGAFVVLRDVNRTDPGSPVQAVDYERPEQFAQEVAPFEVLAPEELPEGWIATSVRFEDRSPTSWHLGLLTDEERYIGIEQAERPLRAMVGDFVDEEAREGATVEVAGATWATWTDPERDPAADPSTDPEGDLALVREDGGTTTLVVGTVSQDALVSFVESLR